MILSRHEGEGAGHARSTRMESYLMRNETESARLGRYSVELVDGELVVSELPPEGWEQLEIDGLDRGKRIGGGLDGHSI